VPLDGGAKFFLVDKRKRSGQNERELMNSKERRGAPPTRQKEGVVPIGKKEPIVGASLDRTIQKSRDSSKPSGRRS